MPQDASGPKRRILSFQFAIQGITTALKEEPNLKIHFVVAIFVIIAGFFFHISKPEWIIIALLIGLVFTLELTNTAIETIVDAFTNSQHPGAKRAKDVSAGAVLVAVITSVVVGLMIFLPYVFRFIGWWH
ncbi:diacylglycerol kinase family protein [Candidatus Daviesbacteria bacterium]|nr:diacylglycerol kinase family protein [Candidatus Daviesbacteria bacterium]